jgi:hypothetical protein
MKDKYIMKLTHNKCKSCYDGYLIQKTEHKFYCSGCRTRYKRATKGALILPDTPAVHIPIDKSQIVMKAPKKEDTPKPKTDESLKKDLWRKAKDQTLKEYQEYLNDPGIDINERSQISDMLIQYHRFGSAPQFSLRAINLYKLYLTQLNIENNEDSTK